MEGNIGFKLETQVYRWFEQLRRFPDLGLLCIRILFHKHLFF